MSKKTKNVDETTQQTSVYDDLLKNGTVVITAKTREELSEIVNGIPAECKYGAGAVGQSRENGEYSMRIDIVH